MYFHDTNKTNGYAAPPHPVAAAAAAANHNYHHYNNNILATNNNNNHHIHYCNDDALVREQSNNEQLSPASRLSQRQSGNQAYIQKSVMNRQTGASGMSYDGAMDSCNTEATLLSEYGKLSRRRIKI